MRIYNIVFNLIFFFLTGVLAATTVKLSFLIIFGATFLTAALFLFFGYFKKSQRLFYLSILSLFIIVGALYYSWYENFQKQNVSIVFDQKINFQGLVVDEPKQGSQQKLTIELKPPYAGKILVKLQPYPSFNYGDVIYFEGVIKEPEQKNYVNYLTKDGIFGISDSPKTDLISQNQGSFVKSSLFKLKEKIVATFQKTLPSEKAAFLSGITLGERAEFSKEFKDAMNKSGTTHLVALSGYNITILVIVTGYLLSSIFSRRLTFWLTLFVIFGFVVMTGAEASVVRAAIMGGILLLAKQVGRLYSSRNAIAIAAFLMVLENPKVLSFDIGFQLSFLALLGIVYLSPAINKFFRVKEKSGFLDWRENLVTTFSAQLAAAPVLILNFGNFSFVSLLANVLILSFIPLTMGLGFILGFLGFFSYYFSLVFGWFVNLFVSYEIFIIKFFGKIDILHLTNINTAFIVIYYSFLLGLIFFSKYRLNKKSEPVQI